VHGPFLVTEQWRGDTLENQRPGPCTSLMLPYEKGFV
jgi:hypothetical protein